VAMMPSPTAFAALACGAEANETNSSRADMGDCTFHGTGGPPVKGSDDRAGKRHPCPRTSATYVPDLYTRERE
jgi:hypothetical protein